MPNGKSRLKPNDISAAMKVEIHRRDDWRCAHCGSPTNLTLQHRKNKQMGGLGSKAPALTMADGITLCWEFNVLITADADAAMHALDHGWQVPRNLLLPIHLIPAYYAWSGEWNFLTLTGKLSPVDSTVAQALVDEVIGWSA